MLAQVEYILPVAGGKSAGVMIASAQRRLRARDCSNARPASASFASPTSKHDAVARFFADNAITTGSKLVIQVPRAGETLTHAKI